MSDRVGVMNEGKLLQVDTPEAIYESPANRFVANFIGETNFVDGEVISEGRVRIAGDHEVAARTHTSPGSRVTLTLRPEKIQIASRDKPADPNRNTLQGKVTRSMFFGETLHYVVDVGSISLDVRVENRPEIVRWSDGDDVQIDFHPEAAETLED